MIPKTSTRLRTRKDTLQRVLSQGSKKSDLHFKWLTLLQCGDKNEREKIVYRKTH